MSGFLQVNGKDILLSEALCWSAIEDSPSFVESTRDRALIRQYALETGISVSEGELQEVIDKVRRELGLESAANTESWLTANRFSLGDFQSACAHLILQEKIWQSFTNDDVAGYFAENREDFTRVTLYGARLKDKATAEDIVTRVNAGEANFHLEAMEHSADLETAPLGGYVGRLTRQEVPEEISVSVFSVDPGELIGPIKLEEGFGLFLVSDIHRPELEDVEQEIRNRLFDQLLEGLLERAVVSVGDQGDRS